MEAEAEAEAEAEVVAVTVVTVTMRTMEMAETVANWDMKRKKRRIRGSENKGNGERVSIWHTCRAKYVESVGSVVLHIIHGGIFLLDTNMKSVLLFHSLVTIQSIWVPTQSALLQVTSLPTSISCLICLHSDTCN
jgi:hypothetical protein